jgi:imidazolonepropionase-like amidohydrolase
MKNILSIIIAAVTMSAMGQSAPAPKQSKSILILNATAHIGNGQMIDQSAIGFKDGKISMVADAKTIRIADNAYDIVIDATGKHVYPGFIAPNSTLGLADIDAVKASVDEYEIGQITPNVRSIIAYNAESNIIPTVRMNGILTAQITPRGGIISGSSSVVQLDSWNWKDALIRENDGIHMNMPNAFRFGQGGIEVNKDYNRQLETVAHHFMAAKSYRQESNGSRNLVLESGAGLFNGSQTLYIHADDEKQIIDGIELAIAHGVQKIVIVGGFEAYKAAGLLKRYNVGVLLRRVHDMPMSDEQDIDLPYKMAKILTDLGVIVGLENAGDMERMNTRNLPFLAGTCAAYGLTKEQALQLITGNTAKLLGIDNIYGTLEIGKDATLFISEGDALDMRTNKLSHAFIQGRQIGLDSHQTRLFEKYKKKYNQ